MKHGDDYTSYYEHIIYPATLFGTQCSDDDCKAKGKFIAFDAVTIGKHLRIHRNEGSKGRSKFFCRACDRIKESFEVI